MDDVEVEILRGIFSISVMMGNAGMLWWVSGLIFCLSLIKATIMQKEKLPNHVCIMTFITILFFTIASFGVVMSISSWNLYKDALSIISKSCLESYPIKTMFDILGYGFLIGSSSFFLVLVIWLYIILSDDEY